MSLPLHAFASHMHVKLLFLTKHAEIVLYMQPKQNRDLLGLLNPELSKHRSAQLFFIFTSVWNKLHMDAMDAFLH